MVHRFTRRAAAASLGASPLLGLAACVSVVPARRVAPPNGGVLDQPMAVPPLTLRRSDGRPFSTGEMSGRLSFVFFGYTSCPDVCPLTLAYVSQVRRQLGPTAPDAYFITVDPERDTPARLTEYMANFDAGIVALTGTTEELVRAREAFGVVAERRPSDDGSRYFVDHTALVYLVDPDMRIRVVYPHGMPPADIVADLRRLPRVP